VKPLRQTARPKPTAINTNTPKRDRFVAEYLKDFNATQAAIRAGYSRKTARAQAHRLLTKVDVQEAVKKANQRLIDKLELTTEMVDREAMRLLNLDPADLFDSEDRVLPIKDMPEDARRALLGMDVEELDEGTLKKLRFHNKVSAIEVLYKRLGALREKVELTGKDGKPLPSIVIARQILNAVEDEDDGDKMGRG
jgi:phage terminase small subunit